MIRDDARKEAYRAMRARGRQLREQVLQCLRSSDKPLSSRELQELCHASGEHIGTAVQGLRRSGQITYTCTASNNSYRWSVLDG